MQVFITNKNLELSAMSLDDLRLNKQIVEINQILMSYLNGDKAGYKNHPINKYYNSFEGMKYLIKYNQALCKEYFYRFEKHHMGYITIQGFIQVILLGDKNKLRKINFIPAFIKGRKGINQVITTNGVYDKYQLLLNEKWSNDIKPPKWTKRNKPNFLKEC